MTRQLSPGPAFLSQELDVLLRGLLGPSAYDTHSSVNRQESAAARMMGARKQHSRSQQHHDCSRPSAPPSGDTNQDPSCQESLVFSAFGSYASFTRSVRRLWQALLWRTPSYPSRGSVQLLSWHIFPRQLLRSWQSSAWLFTLMSIFIQK